MNIEQAQALAMICHYAKEYLKDNKTMSQSVDIAKDIIEKELKETKQYKDIEEELGIDLVTLFKVLKNGSYVYYKKGKKIERGVINYFLNVPNAWYITICGNDKFYSTRKYGKTWALTKEELL